MTEEKNIDKTFKDSRAEGVLNTDLDNISDNPVNGLGEQEPQSTNNQLPTENMEVHHHPHVEKKNFKEYLLEGLMIFVAVTMGFIAENVREYIGDKSKEKEYILSIKKDLATDTAALNIWIPTLYSRINDFDSLISLLQNSTNTKLGSTMYYYARLSTRARVFSANDNTIIELKNSGNFRLITNKAVVSAITNFEKLITSYLNLSAVDNKEGELLYPSLGKLFDAGVFNSMVVTKYSANLFSVDSITANLAMDNLIKPQGNPQLRSHNPDDINQLIFYLHERKSSFVGEARLLVQQKKNASDLITLMNDQYKLADE